VENGERWLQSRDQDGPIHVSSRVSISHHFRIKGFREISYPIAKVRQSEDGARAVIGSKIVRADMCSDVDGSNSITLPWEFPIRLVRQTTLRRSSDNSLLTKGDIPIPHPYCYPDLFIGCKPRHLISSQKIPHNSRLT
jgi:hypothetical protein